MIRTVLMTLMLTVLIGCASDSEPARAGGPIVENPQFTTGKKINPPKGCKEMRERAARDGKLKEANC